uniref:H(+)/Pi cotransporter n=1 Tax=Ananas comosus var. bracteatus TaxID=296719 RepID=A0A6V7PWC8_ANACO|nr:unnamed protein product [Ananas comosus var. bracteatus]
MFGSVPAAMTYYWRMKMPETARYTALVAKNAERAAADMAKVLQVDVDNDRQPKTTAAAAAVVGAVRADGGKDFGLFSREFVRRHGLHLVGTASTWLLLDVAYYSQNLFQKDIFSAIGWIPEAATMNALEELYYIGRAQTLIALCGTVPGYWFTVGLIDILGRFTIQVVGFFMMTAFMLGLAVPYHHWTTEGNHTGFVVMYAFTFFFANFGPNSTTFIVPAEIFPARLRATCHGISAASGKLGAIVGSFGFLYLAQSRDPAKTDRGYPRGSACATRSSCSPPAASAASPSPSSCRSRRGSRSRRCPERSTRKRCEIEEEKEKNLRPNTTPQCDHRDHNCLRRFKFPAN